MIEPRKKIGWCGPAALSYALRNLGIDVSQDELAKLMSTTEEGTTPFAMLYACQTLGFKCRWVENTTLRELKKIKKAEILLDYLDDQSEESGHWARLNKIEATLILIDDPSYPGRITTMERKAFEKIWYDFVGKRKFIRGALIIRSRNANRL
jgi:ABC-type bacteriocin/lantibiotic exporter with double-glycine peptidase domain